MSRPIEAEGIQGGDWRRELACLYADLDAEIANAGPRCDLSGRCCRFKEYGHTLFLSAPELTVLLDEAPRPVRGIDDGSTCPWQDGGGRCIARGARPSGCRIYFCDPSFETLAHEVTERFLRRLKALVDEHGLTWNYAPLHAHLRSAQEAGLFPREGGVPAISDR
jgi:hypothetical protein